MEGVLRALLAAAGRVETEGRAVTAVRDLLRAEWTAIVEEEQGGWRCLSASGADPRAVAAAVERIPLTLPPADASGSRVHGGSEAEPALTVEIPRPEGAARTALLVGRRVDGTFHGDSSRQLLERVSTDVGVALQRADELDLLRSHAYVDPLTGCYNRRGFDERLLAELNRGDRYGRPTALILVDLDDFKLINDELGHPAGDHVLRRFAQLLNGTFRNTDVISRFGGDEFAILFPETTTAVARRLAERVRTLQRDLFPDGVIPRRVTASFGVAAAPDTAASASELVAMADRALYAAKTGGRDRVVVAEASRGSAGP